MIFLFGVVLIVLIAELCLLWWKNHSSSAKVRNSQEHADVINGNEQDLEAGGDHDDKHLEQLKSCCSESVDIELMRLHNLNGPPKFLFTIKEETEEDLETKCLNDFLASTDLTPLASPKLEVESLDRTCNVNDFDHLFESSVDAEISNLRSSSPPSKFKFLREADEKWLRKLMEQVEKDCQVNCDGM
ncbi:hypothetical protein AgCh_034517 [Apium graveolens]